MNSARSKPPPSTEDPSNDARMGHNGGPRAARVEARRCSVPGRGAGCPPGAAGIDITDPVRDRAGPRRVRSSGHQSGGSRLFWERARPYCPTARRTVRIDLSVDHPARPDALAAPVGAAAIDCRPFPVRGRPPMPGGTRVRHPTQRSRKRITARCVLHACKNIYFPNTGCGATGYWLSGAVLSKM